MRRISNLNIFTISKQFNRYYSQSIQSLVPSLAFIGGGQMAEAMLKALHSSNLQRMEDVTIYDVNSDRLEYMRTTYGVKTNDDINEAVRDADLVILACKPQNLGDVAKSVDKINGVLMSILAGTAVSTMQRLFNTKLVIRCMPNTPATVQEGMTVWFASKEVPSDIVQKAKQLLLCTGDEILVKDEALVDMSTAISGTGPAYVFLTVEAMVDAAVHMGLPRAMATRLVNKTIKGSVVYAQSSGHSVSTLRNNVTSPGGTTASALYQLEKGGYRTVMADAVWACYRRALELGGDDSNVGPGRTKQ